MRFLRSLAFVTLLTACEREPVQWGEPARLDSAQLAAAGSAWRLGLGAGATLLAVRDTVIAFAPPGACPGLVAVAHERGGEWHAAWFRARADSSVALEVAHTRDGGATWSAPLVADSSDHGRRGCARPAPAIAADSTVGFVHVAYYLEPSGGGAVWLVHSMDDGATWHPPVALSYGADSAAASVAARGDTVVVAFESPNANEGWIDVAISLTAGHLIDHRVVAVSGRSVRVRAPRVAMRGATLAVAWITSIGALAMARVGTLR